jgi:hypothetical protein
MSVPDADTLQRITPYPRSVTPVGDATFLLIRHAGAKQLAIAGTADGFECQEANGLQVCPLNAHNAAVLRERIGWLCPQPLGLARSMGCGDRLGLATPGHIRALRRAAGFAPVLAQQSVRENERTGRTPAQVLDDAMWGVFQEGWRAPWGADADHLKTAQAADGFIEAGYTLFTIDPGDHVDNAMDTAPLDELRAGFERLPWDALSDAAAAMRNRYLGRAFVVENEAIVFDEPVLLRAACKYGRAIAHTAALYRYLATRLAGRPWEMEISVDETETPTTPAEHWFIASELRRLGVQWVSLAPRYVGRFEKGVDYIGDLAHFEAEFARHAAIARTLGPYKLSLHSGSDKFGIYPIVARHTRGLAHVKTAGTSYLEALRTIAFTEPALLRQIWQLARERYDVDRATYHVSADLSSAPDADGLPEQTPVALLDQPDARQALHVTFGSVLACFGARLRSAIQQHEEEYYAAIESHFARHLDGLGQCS